MFKINHFIFTFFCIVMMSTSFLFAIPVLYETEPNNTPVQANTFSGATTLEGDMTGGDQDAFMWHVSKEDAKYAWNFELEGMPGALTKVDVMHIEFTEDNTAVTDYKTFMTFGSSDGAKPVYVKDIFVEEGKYLFAFSYAGGKKKSASPLGGLNISLDGTTKKDVNLSNVPSQIGYRLHIKSQKQYSFQLLKSTSEEKPYKLRANSQYSFQAVAQKNWFVFSLSEKESQKRWELLANTVLGEKLTVVLRDESGKKLLTLKTDKKGKCSFPDLAVEAKKYYLEIYGSKENLSLQVKLRLQGTPIEGEEAEPNNGYKQANSIDFATPITGRGGVNNDWDYFRFQISDDESEYLRTLLLEGEENAQYQLCLVDDKGKDMQCRKGKNTLTLSDLLLAKGRYFVAIKTSKKGHTYTLSMLQEKEYRSILEAEPNDREEYAVGMNEKRIIKGKFAGSEWDCFHFNVAGKPQMWRIQAVSEGLKELRLYTNANHEIQSTKRETDARITRLDNLYFLPGKYKICVYGKDTKYMLRVLPLGEASKAFLASLKEIEALEKKKFEKNSSTSKPTKSIESKESQRKRYLAMQNIEHEPNDEKKQSNTLRVGQNIKGTFTNTKDKDYFHFILKNEEHIRLTASVEKNATVSMWLTMKRLKDEVYIENKEINIIEGVYPKGKYSVRLHTTKKPIGVYNLHLESLNIFDVKEGNATKEPLAVKLGVKLREISVASYSDYGQKVPFTVTIQNNESNGTLFNLESHCSNDTWKIQLKETLNVNSAETKSIEGMIYVSKYAPEGNVRIDLRVSNDINVSKTVSFPIEVKLDAKEQNVYKDWGMSAVLLGGLNVAREDFGARRVIVHKEKYLGYVPDVGKNYHLVFDGLSHSKKFFFLYGKKIRKDPSIAVKLLGDTPVEVLGVSLNTLGDNIVYRQLKDFKVDLSLDGKVFETVYAGTAKLNNQDQYFEFDNSYQAKYAKITLLNSHESKKDGEIYLSEFKVIAKQDTLGLNEAFNIANPDLGGHIVKSFRELSRDWDKTLLAREKATAPTYIDKVHKEFFTVLGFRHERVAKITNIEWVESANSKIKDRIKKVKIEISTQTPNGPWTEIDVWDRNATIDSNSSTYTFKDPVWARYLKFSAFEDSQRKYFPPEILKVYEQKPDANYKSILGEWGGSNHESFYEFTQNKQEHTLDIVTGNENNATAYTLGNNRRIRGEVSVAHEEEDWYRIEVKKGENLLIIGISNPKSVDVAYTLYDENNTRVLVAQKKESLQKHSLSYDVSEGSYLFKINQPIISVVFAWDNSGSVSPYHDQIFNGINNYTHNIKPSVDSIHLLCFNNTRPFLLSDFSDNPFHVLAAFNNFDWGCNSSDAENALLFATKKLEKRIGTKGVIVIADAEGMRTETLWETLKKVRPKVFSIRVKSGYDDSDIDEGVMQSWTRIHNGNYDVVSNEEEMSEAISKASAILRRPVTYSIEIESKYERPLGKGSLQIVKEKSKTKKAKNDMAIELILDASGSMLQKIKGKRRINIAKDVLKKAIQESIPENAQVALRVFGHKKAGKCHTSLVMKLQELNIQKTSKIISKIKAKNLAKTPIAASLAKISKDLKKAKGKKVIILVTDGEETCDGDPAKEIQKLKDMGYDIRLNIVGFAIDDKALKSEFVEWAKLGNGEYFEAKDAKSLHESVTKALQTPYVVYDSEHKEVGKGIIGGDALPLKGGVYTIEIANTEKKVYEEVRVVGEEMTILKYE